MEIIQTSKEMSTKDRYNMTMSPDILKMKDAVSQRIEVVDWCVFKDTNSKGEENTIMSLSTPDGEVFATNSPTFMEEFFKIQTLFAEADETVTAVKVSSGTSKTGREFITCVYSD